MRHSLMKLNAFANIITFSDFYAEYHYAECHYAECHYTECRGAK
jgi:hypothetical protein